jgi:hypothetical protein
MTKKRKLFIGIAGGLAALLIACGVAGWLGWRGMNTYFQQQYYRQAYEPIELTAEDIGGYPAQHHLDDVPWIATQEAYCQSNSLRMIAAQHGIEEPREYFDFLMGFTYGGMEWPGHAAFFPYTDPETGLAFAAPYLGLARRYYTTSDKTLYLDALRYYLSQGYAVRVALDLAVVHNLEEQFAHSEVLVGYDEAGFYYYETVCRAETACEPRHLPPGEKGLYVPNQLLLDAVAAQAKAFSYPWRYNLTVFEEGSPKEDLAPVWARNGQSLVGGAQYGPRQGADAIEKLAATFEERGVKINLAEIRSGIEVAVYIRHDNAAYLREAFPGEPDVERAADLFDRASGNFEAVLKSTEDGVADQAEADQIAAWLCDAAAAEREIGQIFLARGQ